jgi:DNA invertase Pin-like site-specific DNA recombinase
MTKSIALYARVSSERQVQQATVDSQLSALRARAAQDGCVVLPNDEYVDNGHSGSSLRRPALERLRDRAAQGALDTIYVYGPDRLARRAGRTRKGFGRSNEVYRSPFMRLWSIPDCDTSSLAVTAV